LSHVFCVDVGFFRHCILFQSWFHLHPYMTRDMVFYNIDQTFPINFYFVSPLTFQ